MRLALSQVKAQSWLRPSSGIPSISTAYAQARRRCAQVIHMFVHRQQGSSPVAWLAGSSGSVHRCLRARPASRMRGSGPGLDEIAPGRQPPDDRRRPEDRPPAHPPSARRSRASRSAAECASPIRSSCPRLSWTHRPVRNIWPRLVRILSLPGFLLSAQAAGGSISAAARLHRTFGYALLRVRSCD